MSNLKIALENLLAKKRWMLHVAFWLTVLVFYVVLFGRQNSNYLQTLFFIGLLMPVTIGTAYFLGNYLVPRFLLKERYGYFFLYFLYTIVGSLLIEMMVVFATFIIMAGLKIQNMSPASFDLFFLLTALLMVVFLSVAIKLLMHWRKSQEDYQKLMHEKVETELKFLKSQLNPHFLFNTLNNLYYLATQKSDLTPKAILSLSEILDYVMNASKKIFVPLEKELRQVENYIDLEMMRYQGRVIIERKILGKIEAQLICPMLLLTLLENAFKHGVMQATQQAWIKLEIIAEIDRIKISSGNSRQSTEIKSNGIGLKNLESQLRYLYGDDYSLTRLTNNPQEFQLIIELPAHAKN